MPNGAVRWLMGLQDDNADIEHDTAFTLQQRTLKVGDHLALGAQRRASEQAVPWFAIDGAPDEFYAALMWSGAWSLAFFSPRTPRSTPPSTSRSHIVGESRK